MSSETRLSRLFSLAIPDIIQCFYIFSFIILTIWRLIQIGFSWNSYLFTARLFHSAVIVITCLLIYGAVLFVKRRLAARHERNGTELLEQYKTKLLIGLIGGLVSSWIPRVFLFSYWWYFFNNNYFIFVSLPAIFLFWYHFVIDAKKKCEIVYDKTEKRPWIIVILNFIALIATVEYGLHYEWNWRRFIWNQLGFATICTTCTLELCQVYRGKVKLIEGSANPGFYENPMVLEHGREEKADLLGGFVPKSKTVLKKSKSRLSYSNDNLPIFDIPDIIQCFYIIIFIAMVAIGLIFFVFDTIFGYGTEKFIVFAAILVTWGTIYGAFFVAEKLVKWVQKACEMSPLAQCKSNLLIGLAGGLIVAWIPRIYIIVDWHHCPIFYYCIFVSVPTISLFWSVFVGEAKKKCEVVYDKTEKLPWIIVISNVILFIVTIFNGMSIYNDEAQERFILCQIGFATICMTCMLELGQVWRGRIRLLGEFEDVETFGGIENPLVLESSTGAQVHKVPIVIAQ